MKKIASEISKVASEVKDIDKDMHKDLKDIAEFLAKIGVENIIEKQAKLINEGDIVVCVDNFGPVFKGRRYLVSNAEIPGFLGVKEMDGSDVGIFAVNRFVLDNNEQ